MGHGGDTSTCAIAAARQGLRVGYLSRLGEDAFGRNFLELWRTEGVDVAGVEVDPHAPTGIYFVSHGPEGHDFTYYRKGSAASLLQAAELPEQLIADSAVLHASGISQAISEGACDAVFRAFELAHAAGRLVSYDTNLRKRLWPMPRARAIINEAIACADILLPGLDDATALTGLSDADAILDRYLRMGPRIVALTLGSQGALIGTPDRRERVAARLVDAVDATGAGDAFDGAFLYKYQRTGDPFAAGRYANAAAGLATTGFGAVAPLPTRDQVLAFIADQRDEQETGR
jgi:2-dehydro-3-deoxygluconokinase